ncbi:hypothetical protein RJ45_05565 [Photobacterium gaetbulicola]|uniref:Uncharacterized protein n=1 Tax=Photobacterium gaetbulicola TaxID=1295392 RepID=A0A0B9G7N0_9GAMM|nr:MULTISPECIES: hypothetical protein [Photobacterium]KHT64599.1 hypothetical protein RJ45_05565 [Photobacterium gaetbulicola]WEM44673.1 hypothetical protein PTW35_25800 [Photobacterium sp. DA100]
MEKLKLAKELFTRPLTLDELYQLDQLERQAKGKERLYIASLWDAAYALVEPAVLHQAREAGLL